MKKTALLILASLLLFSCRKETDDMLIGKWRFVKSFSMVGGGNVDIPVEDQRIEEYTKDHLRILSDFRGNEISRCNYSVSGSAIRIFGKEINGKEWSSTYTHWFQHDTLAIKHDGGWEYYNEYFIRVK